MNNLTNFKANEISLAAANNVKGGNNFCEWYINQRTSEGKKVNQGQINKAMELDAILYAEGYDAAMSQGGAAFLAKID
ncbi:MAG: hypothetical protein HC803_08575 [Saprospiraceae bacterium]|nr:hypothetical protein [Saprospiraceae bacterium]